MSDDFLVTNLFWKEGENKSDVSVNLMPVCWIKQLEKLPSNLKIPIHSYLKWEVSFNGGEDALSNRFTGTELLHKFLSVFLLYQK